MPNKEEVKDRKRIVVEEVSVSETPKKDEPKEVLPQEPLVLDESAKVSSKDLVSNETVQLSAENPPEIVKKPSSPVFWIIIPGIFLLGAILGGIVFYQKGVNKGEETALNPSPIASTSPIPSASPVATPDLTKYSITVFNGSGISGEAGRAKTLLTTAGFSVGSTSNAASYDYTKTIIKAKSSVETSYTAALSAALGRSYVVDALQTLSDSSKDNVQVIIGSLKP